MDTSDKAAMPMVLSTKNSTVTNEGSPKGSPISWDLTAATLVQTYTNTGMSSTTEHNPVRCPDPIAAKRMEQLIGEMKAVGDTIGGVVTCVVKGCPKGIGEPEFGKLHAMLGAAMLSINAAKGFEYGEGFNCATARGSELNDAFITEDRSIRTVTNHSGGIQGGISNGEDIYFRTAFKPTATILQEQTTVDNVGNSATLCAKGRHDPCVLPRAVPIVEAMASMVILDYIMLNKATNS